MYNSNMNGGVGAPNSNNGMNGMGGMVGGGDHQRYQPLSFQGMPQVGGNTGNQQLNSSFPPGRRSTGTMNRRQPAPPIGALPLDASMQELFGQGANPFARRSSGPFPDGIGDIIIRRESLDSTTAVLDACILDLARRRYSVANGLGQQGGNDQNQFGLLQQHSGVNCNQGGGPRGPMDPSNLTPVSNAGIGMMGNLQGHYGGASGVNQQNYVTSSIAAKHELLQQKQLELELERKHLDLERQQQDYTMQAAVQAAMQHNQGGGPMMGGSGMGMGMGVGGIGDGGGMRMNMQEPPPLTASRDDRSGNQPQQQWWICQICNSKAFASRDEANHHEAICQEGHHSSIFNDPPRPLQSEIHLQQQHRPQPHSEQHSIPHAQHGIETQEELQMESNGPFSTLPEALPLAMLSDKDWLTPLHCFVRRHCVEVFCASNADVQTPSKGKRKPIQVGQVGIRCPHCHNSTSPAGQRERGSVYYPTTISSIYNATMNLLQRHLNSCTAVPPEIMDRYMTLKADDARSGTSKKYWVESALSLGLVDTVNGIRFSALRPPPLPHLSRQQRSTGGAVRRNSNDFFSTTSNTVPDLEQQCMEEPDPMHASPTTDKASMTLLSGDLSDTGPLVTPDDKSFATAFSYRLLGQMQSCVFTEADRLGKRKGLPPGFPGLACRHCFGGYGSGRFFPSSIKTLSDTSKTLNVLHNHMMRCRKCPPDVRDTLEKLRSHHDDERAKMKFGSQKAFFAKIWARLHDGTIASHEPATASAKRKMSSYDQPSKMASYEPPVKMASYEPPFKQRSLSPTKFHQMMNSMGAQHQQMQQMQNHMQQQQQQRHNHDGMEQNMPSQLLPNLAHLQQQLMGGGLDVLSRQAVENDMKRDQRHM